jgi:hypothetical protein
MAIRISCPDCGAEYFARESHACNKPIATVARTETVGSSSTLSGPEAELRRSSSVAPAVAGSRPRPAAGSCGGGASKGGRPPGSSPWKSRKAEYHKAYMRAYMKAWRGRKKAGNEGSLSTKEGRDDR